jgi:Protein of unknown function (DUF3405).
VSPREYRPEYPISSEERADFPFTVTYTGLPTPTPYNPFPAYDSVDYTLRYHEVEKCFLDKDGKVPVPSIYAYPGVVQGQPRHIIGSYEVLGFRDDVCFDRFGRFGPYGLGYTIEEGGFGAGLDTENEGSEVVWESTGKIDYSAVDWGDAQTRCHQANQHRFHDAIEHGEHLPSFSNEPSDLPRSPRPSSSQLTERETLPRTAIVIRAYTGYLWTAHAVLNVRAMISEAALSSGAEYSVHILLHVRDDHEPIWADPDTVQEILDRFVPPEFHDICTLWSEAQMRVIYPVRFGPSFRNPSGTDIHGVYRSAYLALQHFAMNHPEYTHFWN